MIERTKIACQWCDGICDPIAPPAIRPNWERVRCGNCGTILYGAMPDPGSLSAIYAEAWVAEEESGANGSTSLLAAESIAKRMVRNIPEAASLLDYGAGTGALSQALARHHPAAEIHAYEPYGPVRHYPGVVWSSAEDGPWSSRQFDLIVLCEVIEHIPDPVGLLRDLKPRLNAGGRIAVTTPNARGVWARVQNGRWREAQNPTHLCLFTEQSLDICARKAGFGGFERLRRPIRYKSDPIRHLCLSALQILGLDGGLRGYLRT